jgi:translocation and assembly module TamB
MVDENNNPTPRKRRRILQAIAGIVLIAMAIAAGWFLTSPSFNALVKARIVSELERATGGHATVGKLSWNLSRLQFEARDVTLHGNEQSEAVPLLHVERVYIDAELVSMWRQEVRLNLLQAERPTIHLITYPDGTTNIPQPKERALKTPVDRLMALAIGKTEIHEGLLLWNERAIPFEFTGNDIGAQISYAAAAQRYEGRATVGKVDVNLEGLRPLAAQALLEFTLARTAVEIKALHLNSGKSRLDASGRVENFEDPVLKLDYRSSIDVREAGSVLRVAELRAGTLEIDGSGSFGVSTTESQGTVAVRKGELEVRGLRAPGIEGRTNFSITRQRVTVRDIALRALGGTITGEASDENWMNSFGPANKRAAEHGSARLAVRGFEVQAAERVILPAAPPLGALHGAGSLTGTIDAQWNGGLQNAVAKVAFDVVPPAKTVSDQIPITARLDGTYSLGRRVLTIAQLNVATPATRIAASGTLGRNDAQLKVSASSSNPHELRPAIVSFAGTGKLPVEVFGPGQFTGTVFGPLSSLSIDGHLELTNFDSIIDVPGTPPPTAPKVVQRARPAGGPGGSPERREVRLHWDHAVADLSASSNQVTVRSATLQRGAARISGNGQASLYKYGFTNYSPFNLRIEVANADVADLQRIMGTNYPVSGSVNMSVGAGGSLDDPRARGRVQVTSAHIDHQPVTTASAGLDLRNHVADLTNIAVVGPPGSITGAASLNLRSKLFSLNLKGTAIDLSKLDAVQSSRTSVAGSATFTAQGSGTLAEPAVNAALRIENVVVNTERVGNIVVDVVTQGTEMRVTGSTRFQTAALLFNGSVHLRDDFPSNFHLTFSHFDVDPLLRAYLQGRVTGHSSIAGDVRIQGPLKAPRQLAVSGELSEVSVEIENVKLAAHEPVRFVVENALLKLDQAHIVGTDTDFSASGTLGLTGTHVLTGSAEGQVNLQILTTMNPALRSTGLMSMTLRAGGTLNRPMLNGRIQIVNAAIVHTDLPNGLSEMNGTLTFSQDRVTLDQVSARTGGGLIELGGSVGLSNGLNFNLTATGRDIRIRYPAGVSSMANLNLRLAGPPSNALLSGTIMITRFSLNPNFDFSVYLASARQPMTIGDQNSPFNNLHLDVHVSSTPELQVQTSLARISGDVDLRLRGTPLRPVVLGRVNIVQGDVFFNGTRYHMERGDVSFTNPTRIDPILNLDLTAHIRDYDVTLGLHGALDHMATNYRSEPPLPTSDIIALLAFGRTREDLAAPAANPNYTETASSAILGQAISSVVSNRVQKLFGVSRIKIDPQVGTATSNPTARVTIEQQVSNNITLTYITDVTQAQQQVIQLEYNINRNVSVVAVRDQYGVVAVDVRIRQRKK